MTHFCFYNYYYLTLFFFFLSAEIMKTIRDRLPSWKSPLALCVSHCSFCVLKSCRHSTDKLSLLFVAGLQPISTARCHSAPASPHTRARLSVFSNFQNLLAAFFFPQQVHTDKPSDFFEKTLAIVLLEFVSCNVTAPRVRDLTLPAQCRLSLRLFCAVSGSESSALIWP